MSPERALSSECSRTSGGQGDCLFSSARICLAYSVARKFSEGTRHAQAQTAINHFRHDLPTPATEAVAQSNILD
jgi:hypothetical protein